MPARGGYRDGHRGRAAAAAGKRAAIDGLGQRRRGDDAATEELEGAGTYRHREQSKAFIVEFAVDQVVQFGVAVDGNAGARVVQHLHRYVRAFEQRRCHGQRAARPASIPCTKAMATVARAGAAAVGAATLTLSPAFLGGLLRVWHSLPARLCIDRIFQVGNIYIVGGVLGNGFIGVNFLPCGSLYNFRQPADLCFFDHPGARTT
jgi:hypothetical protein